MQYRKLVKDSDDLSVLGFGCMRFKDDKGKLDLELAQQQLLLAYRKGVNYFDTAYFYHNGKSEGILGDFINTYDIRDKVFIADKLPCFLVKKPEHIAKFFQTQLTRLNTHYIDYYLMHMLDSLKQWEALKAMGIEKFIAEKKASGEIRHIGFSFHGRQEEFIKILEDYPWDFCQIQYNYIDEHYQAGITGLKRAAELGIGVVVMEPLRGGNLAHKTPSEAVEIFSNHSPDRTPAHWAFRWLFNQPEVAVVLSGMNEDIQIEENIMVADYTQPNSMDVSELEVIEQVKGIYKKLMKVPCTGCNYCVPCPYNVDIPGCFSDYNTKYFFKNGSRISTIQYMYRCEGGNGGGKSGADRCTKCNVCVSKCPQGIDIPTNLAAAHKDLNNTIIRWFLKIFTYINGSHRRNKKSKT